MNVRCLISITPVAWGLAHFAHSLSSCRFKVTGEKHTIPPHRTLWVWTFIGDIWVQWHAWSDRGQTLTSLSACQAVFTGHRWKHARVRADSYSLICHLILVLWRKSHVIFFRSAAWGNVPLTSEDRVTYDFLPQSWSGCAVILYNPSLFIYLAQLSACTCPHYCVKQLLKEASE